MSYQVFISHSSDDAQVANAICHALENESIRCWIAPRDVRSRDSFLREIMQGIKDCDVFLLIFSENVNSSEFVKDEIFQATKQGKTIIPFRIMDSLAGDDIDLMLGRKHWLNAYPNWEEYFEELCSRVKINLVFDESDSDVNSQKVFTQDNQGIASVTPTQEVIKSTASTQQQDNLVAKPSWAETTGKDQYGQYADLVFKGIRQRFRYIEAGEFMMGSPEYEPERENNETQHKVQLTNGYWIADTACTQEMWEAVVGSNPSSFKGDNLPVENVSWEDINDNFLASLRQQTGDKSFRLPTEAEWEYACRAGTQTPFSFGNTISSVQVNFAGIHPYNNNSKSDYRKKTVEVGTLPANAWGLYEMHGNVWEWCTDWYGSYEKQKAINPIGPQAGEGRVVRGGSWNGTGRGCRSADRGRVTPDFRYDVLGFRLSSGHRAEPS